MLAVFVWWMVESGGYFEGVWMPAEVVILAIGAAAVFALRERIALPNRLAKLALFALGGYVAWSFLSILWAGSPGDALEGSQRSLLYLTIFALFVLLPWTGRSVLWAITAVVSILTVFAVVTLVRLAGNTPLDDLIITGRLLAPLGYTNATAALWSFGALPALMLATRQELPPWLRPPLLAGSALMIGLAILTQSRGWLFTLPIMALAVLVLSPDRLKLCLYSVPVLGGVALVTGDLLEINTVSDGRDPDEVAAVLRPVLDTAVTSLALVCLVALIAGVALVAAESRGAGRFALAPRVRRLVSLAVVAVAITAGTAGIAIASHGHPVAKARAAWTNFKDIESDPGGDADRLTSLGSTRYDVWRVAIDTWADHPIGGLGQDNFLDTYATRRRQSFDEPRWVHSLPLRLIAHTGVVGAALFAAFLFAVASAAARVWRRSRRASTRAAAGAALIPSLVWIVHGSVDWLWEFPLLTGVALALAGAVVALDRDAAAEAQPAHSPRTQRALRAGAVAVVVAGAIVFLPTFISDRETRAADRLGQHHATLAYDRLKLARALNPLKTSPWLIEARIAQRNGDLRRAEHAYGRAADLDPLAWFPRFSLGLIASAHGERARARRELQAAADRNPRDPVIRDALRRVGRGNPMGFAEARRRFNEHAARRRGRGLGPTGASLRRPAEGTAMVR
jgi:Flp pilus assembly protein TadD